ncbi:MAG: DUF4388 domain-containing protein [Ardenticatenaceae bacterium]|nr:DUF4388 domain-containing protein [Ardenticatenaceae bacterium]
MALKGNLRDFTTTQLFNLIHLAKKTGTLTVTGGQTAHIIFRSGKLVYAETSVQHGRLTQILLSAGKLTSDQSRLIDEKLKGRTDKQLGHRLIQAKLVTQNDIIQSIRQHMLDIVYKLFTWVEGSFQFDNSLQSAETKIMIPIDLEVVIMEGSRRLQESELLMEELPNLEASLRFVDRPDARLRNINLTVEEWRIISYVNPKNTIKKIAEANKLSDFQVRRTVYGMLQAGIVELIPPVGGANGEKPKENIPTQRRIQPPKQSTQERRGVVNRLIDRIRKL